MLHVLPRRAFVGAYVNAYTAVPHSGSFGVSLVTANGAVVRTLPSITAHPYCLVTSRLFLPMNPTRLSAQRSCAAGARSSALRCFYIPLLPASLPLFQQVSILRSTLITSFVFGTWPFLIALIYSFDRAFPKRTAQVYSSMTSAGSVVMSTKYTKSAPLSFIAAARSCLVPWRFVSNKYLSSVLQPHRPKKTDAGKIKYLISLYFITRLLHT